MKLRPVTKLNKRNKTTMAITSKNGDNVMSKNYDVAVIFPIYGQFEAIKKLENLHFHLSYKK